MYQQLRVQCGVNGIHRLVLLDIWMWAYLAIVSKLQDLVLLQHQVSPDKRQEVDH